VLQSILPLATVPADPPPDNSVVAGWVAFLLFVVLILAIAFLGFSLVKHLRKANEAAGTGAFDASPEPRERETVTTGAPAGAATGGARGGAQAGPSTASEGGSGESETDAPS
jgi:hypothetical protein